MLHYEVNVLRNSLPATPSSLLLRQSSLNTRRAITMSNRLIMRVSGASLPRRHVVRLAISLEGMYKSSIGPLLPLTPM